MPRLEPPRDKRFPVNRPPRPHTKKHPNGYFICRLRRFLKKHINYEDPETQKIIKGEVGEAVLWRLILNATQGETPAIKEILDRVDGKVTQKLEGEGFENNIQVLMVNNAKDIHSKKKRQDRHGDTIQRQAREMLREQG
jgi:hypothetical protein